jgi:hypothetical protein
LQRCREEDPTLVTKYKPRKREGERTTPGTEERKAKRRKDKLDSCEICKYFFLLFVVLLYGLIFQNFSSLRRKGYVSMIKLSQIKIGIRKKNSSLFCVLCSIIHVSKCILVFPFSQNCRVEQLRTKAVTTYISLYLLIQYSRDCLK